MPRKAKELTDLQVRRLKHGVVKGKAKNKDAAKHPKGTPCTVLHAVGGVGGLYLQVTPSGARSWILKFRTKTKAGRNREMGLGSYPEVTLSKAREKARELKEQVREGEDPVLLKQQKQVEAQRKEERLITFREVFKSFLAKKRGEIAAKGVAQLENTFKRYVLPAIGPRIAADISAQDIYKVLTQPLEDRDNEPLWECKNTTADGIRGWLDQLFEHARFLGVFDGDNPAAWKGNLKEALAKPSKVHKARHHPSLPFKQAPEFITDLRQREALTARALEFIILTAVRINEAQGARWDEFDLDKGMWTIPAERMKADRDHTVPLSDAALATVKNAPKLHPDFVFPSPRGKQLSDAGIGQLIKRMHEAKLKKDGMGWVDPMDGRRVVTHGFRSTFKDWATETTDVPDFISEMALAHKVGNEVRQAYQRSDLAAKRLRLMRQWARFLGYAEKGAKVVQMEARA